MARGTYGAYVGDDDDRDRDRDRGRDQWRVPPWWRGTRDQWRQLPEWQQRQWWQWWQSQQYQQPQYQQPQYQRPYYQYPYYQQPQYQYPSQGGFRWVPGYGNVPGHWERSRPYVGTWYDIVGRSAGGGRVPAIFPGIRST